MRLIRKMLRKDSDWSRALAACLVVLFLVGTAFAASPALHQALHSDAKSPDHQCIISVLAHGQIDISSNDAPVCRIPDSFGYTPTFQLSFCVGSVEFLPPGRGPPLFLS